MNEITNKQFLISIIVLCAIIIVSNLFSMKHGSDERIEEIRELFSDTTQVVTVPSIDRIKDTVALEIESCAGVVVGVKQLPCSFHGGSTEVPHDK